MFGFKVICWALLFIFKLRFPPGVSIATFNIKVKLKSTANIYHESNAEYSENNTFTLSKMPYSASYL
jgi:hypothetical protein